MEGVVFSIAAVTYWFFTLLEWFVIYTLFVVYISVLIYVRASANFLPFKHTLVLCSTIQVLKYFRIVLMQNRVGNNCHDIRD
jgi:hypothetical protein